MAIMLPNHKDMELEESDGGGRVLLGFIAYVVVEAKEGREPQLFVQELVVDKDARSQGLATRLLEEALQLTPEAAQASLVVDRDNWNAILLYTLLGFQEASDERLVDPRESEFYMRVDRELLNSRVKERAMAEEQKQPAASGIVALELNAYPSRQRLALEGLQWHREVLRLVRLAHGTSATLPRDWNARRKVRYVLATGRIRRDRSPRAERASDGEGSV